MELFNYSIKSVCWDNPKQWLKPIGPIGAVT